MVHNPGFDLIWCFHSLIIVIVVEQHVKNTAAKSLRGQWCAFSVID